METRTHAAALTTLTIAVLLIARPLAAAAPILITDTLPTLPCPLDSQGAFLMAQPLSEVIANHLHSLSAAQIIQQDTSIINGILDSLAHPGTWRGEPDKIAMEHLKDPAAHGTDLCFNAYYLQQLRAEVATLSAANPH